MHELGSLPFIPSEVRLRSSLMTWGVDQNQSPGLFGGASENEGKTCSAWTLEKHVCLNIWIWHMLSMDLAEAVPKAVATHAEPWASNDKLVSEAHHHSSWGHSAFPNINSSVKERSPYPFLVLFWSLTILLLVPWALVELDQKGHWSRINHSCLWALFWFGTSQENYQFHMYFGLFYLLLYLLAWHTRYSSISPKDWQ